MPKALWRLSPALLMALGLMLFTAPQAGALVLGPGETATTDFDFAGAVSGATPQPLVFHLEVTTSGANPFDSPTGLFNFEYLDIGAGGVNSVGYDATGGVTSLGIISVAFITTDVTGSLRFGVLDESIEVIGITMSIVDNLGTVAVETTALAVPETADVQIAEPGTLFSFLLGLLGLGMVYRRPDRRAETTS